MKNNLLTCSLILGIVAFNANAQETIKDGFSGNISVGAGVRYAKSNTSPLANSSNLNSDNKDTEAIPFLGLELSYGNLLGADKVFLKSYNGRNLSGISLGYEKLYANANTSIEAVSSLREKAYENPYAQGDREETDVTRYGAKITQGYALDFGKFSASYLFAKNNYDKETLAYDSLRRDGFYHEFEVAFQQKIFEASLHYDYNDADGKAASFNRYGFGLSLRLNPAEDVFLTPKFSYSLYETKENDPIFLEKQDGNILKFGLNLTKTRLLQYENLYGFVNYSAERKDSNIEFYDETYQVFLVGIGYKF